MIDRRFPKYARITRLPKEVRDSCAEICRRTYAKCALDTSNGSVYFYLGDHFDIGLDSYSTDRIVGREESIVRNFMERRIPAKLKRRAQEQGERSENTDKQRMRDEYKQERYRQAREVASYQARKPVSVGP